MEAESLGTLGSWAVFFGGMLEGEAVFIAAGYAISQGLLDPLPTFLLAVLGSTLGDHLYYALGRVYGDRLIRRSRLLRRLRRQATKLLNQWGRSSAFLIRFAYGFRVILPMSMGGARFPARVFLPFNVLAALVFASFYLSVGYFFGELAEELFGRMRERQGWVVLLILVLGALAYAFREWRLVQRAEADEHSN